MQVWFRGHYDEYDTDIADLISVTTAPTVDMEWLPRDLSLSDVNLATKELRLTTPHRSHSEAVIVQDLLGTGGELQRINAPLDVLLTKDLYNCYARSPLSARIRRRRGELAAHGVHVGIWDYCSLEEMHGLVRP
jgi:hypothetical protein